jgi:TRAP transporter TAXI family solute receptor
MKRILAALAAFTVLAAACQAPRGTQAPGAQKDFTGRPMTIATGGTGGVYIVYGAGLANVLQNKLKVSANAQSTTASVDNMKLVRDKSADLAFVLSDTAFDAVKGQARFAPPETPAKAQSLAVLYTNFTHIVTKEGVGINTVADLRGKRVSVGSPGSGTEVIANRVLEAYNMTQTDLRAEKLGVADSANGLRDGRLDAFFWSGGLPTSAVLDLANAPGVRLKLLDHADGVRKMSDKYGPFYFNIAIPKNTYKNEADVPVSGVANLLVAHQDMEEDLVYAVLQTMFDSRGELELVHVEAKNLTLETAVEGSPIDFHPGAIKYYREKGVWKR